MILYLGEVIFMKNEILAIKIIKKINMFVKKTFLSMISEDQSIYNQTKLINQFKKNGAKK
jgi:hypothetical protein